MTTLAAILCDGTGTPLAADGPLIGVTSASVTLTQLDAFEGHQLQVSAAFRRNLAAIAPWTTVKLVEQDAQTGTTTVGWGVIVRPETQIADGGATITLTLPNITEQLRLTDTDIGWVASNTIATIVQRLGALRPGWGARFVDDGTRAPSAAPVQWTGAVNVAAAANTLTKTGGANLQYDAGAVSAQVAASGDCAVSFVALSTITSVACGLTRTAGTPTLFTIDFGLLLTLGNVYRLESGVLSAPIAQSAVGDVLRVSVESGVVRYYRNNLLIATSSRAPSYPLRVAGLVADANAQLGGATFTRTTTASEAWYAVRYELATPLDALGQLAADTFNHIRQGVDAAGAPARLIEFGQFGAPATLWLVDGHGGAVEAINENPDVRVIRTLTGAPDATTIINSVVPLGSSTGDTQVTVERCWRIVNDPTYPNYGKYGAVPGTVFPEYDPAYPITRRAALDGRYSYRLTAPASIAFWEAQMGGEPGSGELRGDFTDSRFAYPDKTDATQEVVARALYAAAKGRLKVTTTVHNTLAVTTTGRGAVPRAGDLVHVRYRDVGSDADGVFTRAAIDADWYVVAVKRTYSDQGATDDWTLSDRNARLPTDASRAADGARQAKASQLVPESGLVPLVVGPIGGDCDVAHPFDVAVELPVEMFRMRRATLRVEFRPVRRTVTVAAEATHQHSYTIPVLQVSVSGTATITNWANVVAFTNNFQFVSVSGTATVNQWGGASVAGAATITNWANVAISTSAGGYFQSFTNPNVPGHNNQASHGTGVNAGAHTNGLATGTGALIVATPVNIDAKAHLAVIYGALTGGIQVTNSTQGGNTVVTDLHAFTTSGSDAHTHSLVAGAATQGASYSASPFVADYQGTATIPQFGTQGGGASISGTASGAIAGTISGASTGTISGSASGVATATLSGSAQGPISGTGFGAASAFGTTTAQFHTIGPDGGHTHDLTPGVVDTSTTMRVQLWVDSGDGNFVDRSPQLGGPWSASFALDGVATPELSQWLQAPGRVVRVRVQPEAVAGQLDGLGAVQVHGTWMAEIGGVSSVVYAA